MQIGETDTRTSLRELLTIIATATRYFSKSEVKPVIAPGGTGEPINPFLLPPVEVLPAWDLGQTLSMHIHLSTSPTGDVFWSKWARKDKISGNQLPSVVWENITYGDWKETRTVEFNVTIPEVSSRPLFCFSLLTHWGCSGLDTMARYGQMYFFSRMVQAPILTTTILIQHQFTTLENVRKQVWI
jgi:hypothetical protein